MSGVFEILFVIIIMAVSTLLRSRSTNDSKNKAGRNAASGRSTASGRNGGYDPSAPPGSRRNPLGRPGTGAGTSASGSSFSRAATAEQRSQGGFQSILNRRFGGRGALADDGHRLSGLEDISCRKFGHSHPETDDMPRYIVHDDPEDGYILLNGKKMLLSEADRYENTI